MKIKLLSSAFQDLLAGRLFYGKMEEGLGEYFFDSLFSDIDALALFGVFWIFVSIRQNCGMICIINASNRLFFV